jgi:hypothetical protein
VLQFHGLGKPWDRLKTERGGTGTDIEGMAALLRRLIGDRLDTKVAD